MTERELTNLERVTGITPYAPTKKRTEVAEARIRGLEHRISELERQLAEIEQNTVTRAVADTTKWNLDHG